MQNRGYWAELRLKQQLGIAGLLSCLAILIWFSVRLVSTRMLHSEECNTVFGAHLLALGQGSISTQTPNLLQLVLAWILPASNRAIDIFISARYLMLEIFWMNILLLALATGERLLSVRGLVALCLAASLAPLWDYGMEICPDNIVLLAVLLLWCSVRVSEPKPQLFLLAGALTAAMQFVTFKSLLYFLPISVGFFLFPPSRLTISRRKLAAWWIAGASAAFFTIGIVYAFFGLWHGYVQAMFSIFKTSGPSGDIEIWSMPGHLIAETPLLLAVAVAGCSAILLLIKRDGFKSQTWSGCAPEAALMLLAITVSLIHPAGFRSGLLFFVPSAFLFAWRYLSREVANVQLPASTLIPIVSVLVFAHALPFGRAIQHLRDSRILRQERLMLVSETLSDKREGLGFRRGRDAPNPSRLLTLAFK